MKAIETLAATVERLTKPTIGCFKYDLKDHVHVTGEFGAYDAFFNYNMAVKRLGEYESTGFSPEEVHRLTAELKTQTERAEAAEKRAEAAIRDLSKCISGDYTCGDICKKFDKHTRTYTCDGCEFEWRGEKGEAKEE
jgi:hypothetical protein